MMQYLSLAFPLPMLSLLSTAKQRRRQRQWRGGQWGQNNAAFAIHGDDRVGARRHHPQWMTMSNTQWMTMSNIIT